MRDYIIKLFHDDAGKPSSIRFVSIVIPVVIVGMWIYQCILNNTLISFGWEDVMAIVGLPAAKAYQKGKTVSEGKESVK